jgi:hypothetical protein
MSRTLHAGMSAREVRAAGGDAKPILAAQLVAQTFQRSENHDKNSKPTASADDNRLSRITDGFINAYWIEMFEGTFAMRTHLSRL